MKGDIPLYNSRITNTYLEYLAKYYPEVDIKSVLDFAGMKLYEVEDPAHWFSQNQVDRFHHILVEKTGNPQISRDAGRFTISAKKIGAIKQYVLGLMSPASIYLMTGKLYSIMSRGASIKVKKLSANRVHVVVTPKPGVNEKPFQCDNRIGTFESLAKVFIHQYAKVDHPNCFHKGDSACIYYISWSISKSLFWGKIRNYALTIDLAILIFLHLVIPLNVWLIVLLLSITATFGLSYFSFYLNKKELTETIKSQGNVAADLLDVMNERYNNALLMQEIGHAADTILDKNKYIHTVMRAMEKRLDFDRGLIMLENEDKKGQLQYAASYGVTPEQMELAQQTSFRMDNPNSKGLFVKVFRDQRSYLVEDVCEILSGISERSKDFAEKTGSKSFICVPVVYNKKAFGVLTVDNLVSKKPLTKSDLNILEAIASQIAIGIANANTFEKLNQSKKEFKTLYEISKKAEHLYRSLLFSSPDAIVVFDLDGKVKYLNPEFTKVFGWSMEDVEGNDFNQKDEKPYIFTQLIYLMKNNKHYIDYETKQYAKNGRLLDVNISATYFEDHERNPAGMLFIVRDISEKKKLEAQLLRAHKLEALGTLVAGVAHEINNPINSIINYAQILADQEVEPEKTEMLLRVINEGGRIATIVRNLLSSSRTTKGERSPTNLKNLLFDSIALIESQLKKDGIILKQNILDNLPDVIVNDQEIKQVFLNILSNAQYALNEKSALKGNNKIIKIEAKKTTIMGSEFVRLIFFDNGPGMKKDIMSKVCDPFYSTKPSGHGTGLGLSISHGIVKDHGGILSFESNEDNFTKVIVDLPAFGADP